MLLCLTSVFAIALMLTALVPLVAPSHFKTSILLGLCFPYLFLINAFIGLGYLLLGKKRCLFFFLAILLNLHNIQTVWAKKYSSQKNDGTSLQSGFSIFSYNVRLFDYYQIIQKEKGKTRQDILNLIGQQDPDIICFQEYYESLDHSFSLQTPLKQLSYPYRAVLSNNNKHFYGNTIFSKFPIIDKGIVPGLSASICIYADVVIDYDTLRIYNFHLASNQISKMDQIVAEDFKNALYPQKAKNIIRKLILASSYRESQIKLLKKHWEQSPYPCVLCGDMNDSPVSYPYHLMHKRFKDAFLESSWGLGKTYIGLTPAFRIDYVFYDSELSAVSYESLNVEYSDHIPVMTRMKFNHAPVQDARSTPAATPIF